jgi:hypothetical protein
VDDPLLHDNYNPHFSKLSYILKNSPSFILNVIIKTKTIGFLWKMVLKATVLKKINLKR